MRRLRIKASSPDQRVSELSGGNQQKVLLARVLCLEPRVLLLDDPTRGIDIGAKAEIQGLISDLAEAGPGGRPHLLGARRGRRGLRHGSSCCAMARSSAPCPATEVTQDGVLGLIAAAASGRRWQTRHRRTGRQSIRGTSTGDEPRSMPRRVGECRPLNRRRRRRPRRDPRLVAERGVYVGPPAAGRLQPRVHAPFHRDRQHPPAVRPGRPGRDHRARDGAGHRDAGDRPLGRIGHGDRRPRCWRSTWALGRGSPSRSRSSGAPWSASSTAC